MAADTLSQIAAFFRTNLIIARGNIAINIGTGALGSASGTSTSQQASDQEMVGSSSSAQLGKCGQTARESDSGHLLVSHWSSPFHLNPLSPGPSHVYMS
jgi:hypothetical protein